MGWREEGRPCHQGDLHEEDRQQLVEDRPEDHPLVLGDHLVKWEVLTKEVDEFLALSEQTKEEFRVVA